MIKWEVEIDNKRPKLTRQSLKTQCFILNENQNGLIKFSAFIFSTKKIKPYHDSDSNIS